MKKSLPALLFVFFAACSSAAGPDAEGILNQADKADALAVNVALSDLVQAQGTYFGIHSTYTTDLNALTNEVDYRLPANVTISVKVADATTYCAEGTSESVEGVWHVTADIPTVTDGSCP